MGIKVSGWASVLWLVAGSCWAQSNVGDLLKMDAKKMTREEVVQLHEGGVGMRGTLANGTPYTEQHKPDGSISGAAGGSGQYSLSGTWRIDEAGKLCTQVAASGGLSFNNCVILWKAGDKYYASPNEGANAAVRERQFFK